MSMMKTMIDRTFYSKEPLSSETPWVAVPLYISVKNTGFMQAIDKVRQIEKPITDMFSQESDSVYPTALLDVDEQFDELVPVMQMSTINEKEYRADIYNYIMIKFPEKGLFWDKMQHMANVLDKLYGYAANFKSDKAVEIQLGERYRFLK